MVSSGGDMSATIGRLGVQAHRSGLTLAESYARMPAHSTISELPPDEQPGFAARHLFGAGAVNRATCVLELLQTWLPDLVVYDTLELGSRPLPPCTGYRTSRTATVRWCRTPPTSPRRSGRLFPRRAMDLIHYDAR